MIRSHNTKDGSFSRAGEKLSTELGEMTVGFRFGKHVPWAKASNLTLARERLAQR